MTVLGRKSCPVKIILCVYIASSLFLLCNFGVYYTPVVVDPFSLLDAVDCLWARGSGEYIVILNDKSPLEVKNMKIQWTVYVSF
jgi:hypothetical protein